VAGLRCGRTEPQKNAEPAPARACFPKIRDEKIVNAILEQFLHSAMIHGQIGTVGNGFAYLMNILFQHIPGNIFPCLVISRFGFWEQVHKKCGVR
jgi:hypothetical protein